MLSSKKEKRLNVDLKCHSNRFFFISNSTLYLAYADLCILSLSRTLRRLYFVLYDKHLNTNSINALLKVLEEEQQSEDKREKTLRSVKDPVERRRLDKVFAVERAKASERIVRITEDNELVLADKMAQLGLIR